VLRQGFSLLLTIGLVIGGSSPSRAEPRKLKACGQDWSCLTEAAAQCMTVQGRDIQSVNFSDSKFNKISDSAKPMIVDMEILYEVWPGQKQGCTIYGRQSISAVRYTEKGRAEQEAAGKSAAEIAAMEQSLSQTTTKNILCQIPRRSDVVATLEMLSFRTAFDYVSQDKGRWQVRQKGRAIATCEPK
jgi:hypothetical protein